MIKMTYWTTVRIGDEYEPDLVTKFFDNIEDAKKEATRLQQYFQNSHFEFTKVN